MATPVIPSVTTSVIDRTQTEVVVASGRTPFIPCFSKYGQGFSISTTATELENIHGKIDINRYGLGLEFAKDSFGYTNQVLTYRLESPEATYANFCLSVDKTKFEPTSYNSISDEALATTDANKVVKTTSFTNINNKLEFVNSILANYKDTNNNKKISFSVLAQGTGAGYGDLFATFSPALEYEKLDSNKDGETNYKFNFIRVEIYEDSNGIIKSFGDPFVFSLIDQDAETNNIIADMYTGDELFVNQISKLKNKFLTLAIDTDTDDYSDIRAEMRNYATIDFLLEKMGQPSRLVLLDGTKKYEIIGSTSAVADAVTGSVSLNYSVSRKVKNDNYNIAADFTNYITYLDSSNVVKYAQFKWDTTNKTLAYDVVADPRSTAQVTAGIVIPNKRYIDGDNAYIEISISEDGTINYSEIGFLRWYIYNYLISHNIKLENGLDDDPTSDNPLFNNAGYLYLPINGATCKARDIIVDFFNNNYEIREILYPKYDFDYVPDWTNNIDVNNAIASYAESVGLTMPILNTPPLYYNIGTNSDNDAAAESDYEVRNSNITLSSYNSLLYGSFINKLHTSLSNGQRIRMPLSYYALMAHLKIDRDYSITEPVANIIKGNILNASRKNFSYSARSEKIEKLRNVQVNCLIDEPDGIYIIDQLTMLKKASKLSRAYLVKVIHRMRKDLPKLLKDLIQNKEITDVISVATERTKNYMDKYLVTQENTKHGIFKTINIVATYNKDTYTLRIGVSVNPIGVIEIIDIPIIII